MKNTNSSNGHLFANKVNVKLNVLCPPVLNRVGREIYSADVVTIDDSGGVHGTPQLLQKTA